MAESEAAHIPISSFSLCNFHTLHPPIQTFLYHINVSSHGAHICLNPVWRSVDQQVNIRTSDIAMAFAPPTVYQSQAHSLKRICTEYTVHSTILFKAQIPCDVTMLCYVIAPHHFTHWWLHVNKYIILSYLTSPLIQMLLAAWVGQWAYGADKNCDKSLTSLLSLVRSLMLW